MPKGSWWIVEAIALTALLLSIYFVAISYSALPPRIATRFGWDGAPSKFGNESVLILLLVIHSKVYLLTSAIPFFPDLVNVPGPRTPGRIAVAIGLIRVVKVETMIFMAYLTWAMIQNAQGLAAGNLGLATIPFVATLLATLAGGLYFTYDAD